MNYPGDDTSRGQIVQGMNYQGGELSSWRIMMMETLIDEDTDDSEMSDIENGYKEGKHDTDEQLIGEDNVFSLFPEERFHMGALDSDGEEDFQLWTYTHNPYLSSAGCLVSLSYVFSLIYKII